MAAYQETEKKTGIHIEFQHPAVGQEKNQFNLLMSSGDYPDVIRMGLGRLSGRRRRRDEQRRHYSAQRLHRTVCSEPVQAAGGQSGNQER